jgi:hypothetical protein
MWHKAVNQARQDHTWSDGKPRAAGWGRMARQHRAVITTGDSRIAKRRGRKKK